MGTDVSVNGERLRSERNEKHTDTSTPLKLSKDKAVAVLIDSDVILQESLTELNRAKDLAERAGLSVESYIVKPIEMTGNTGSSFLGIAPNDHSVDTTTGGHSNTDHVILSTGNERIDRIAELKRNLLRRHRAMVPEQRQENKWDKLKAPGGRRRRIMRDQDNEDFPSNPPLNGWNIFINQMTTKIRHDRQDELHDQSKVLQEIGKIWRVGMSPEGREYYSKFARDANEEYEQQIIEFRATGTYQLSKHFGQIENSNIWIRLDFPSPLEKEILSYETINFPPRPPEFDEAYKERELRRTLKRKLKVKGLMKINGSWNDDVDFESLVEEEKEKRRKLDNK